MAYSRTENSGDVSARWQPNSREIAVMVGTGVGRVYLTVDEAHQLIDDLREALRDAAQDDRPFMIDDRHRLDQVDSVEARSVADTVANLAVSLTYAAEENTDFRGERLAQANAAVNLAILWRTYAAMHEADEQLPDRTQAGTKPARGSVEVGRLQDLITLASDIATDPKRVNVPIDFAYRPDPWTEAHTL
ncbi:hypothetical protein [Rhodococcus pyridinivorans]|uniref:hypothetical protein n=1 Tax=Rhodococcus pyridinivorans TaxID=103816 RepID=UPI0018E05759|nr:hypothetical protein [Rhodococcus pyridinivorans]